MKICALLVCACALVALTSGLATDEELIKGIIQNKKDMVNLRFHRVQAVKPDVTMFPISDATNETLRIATMRVVKSQKCPHDQVLCGTKCDQGKLIDEHNGCCKCTCKIGYQLGSDSSSCNTATWGSWSAWSTCIKAEWGGLQTRGRVCKSNGVMALSRCEGAGSQDRKCSAVTKPFRIRKNVRTLTDEEMHDLIQAYTKFKADTSSDGFNYIAKWHGWPFECPWYKTYAGHDNGHCSWHEHPLFLTWHRLIVIQFEMGMNKYLIDKTLGMPYWDWTEVGWERLPYLVRDSEIFDPVLNRYVKNPFYSTYMPTHEDPLNMTCHTWRFPNMAGVSYNKLLLRSVIRAMNMYNYATYDPVLEDPHSQIHFCLCVGKTNFEKYSCTYSMLYVAFSAFDPIFALHHSQIDRLFSLYKEIHDVVGNQDWTKSSFIGSYAASETKMTPDISGSFDWPLSPFCNVTMNPNHVTLNPQVWTVRNAFYYQQLFGYKYDTLNLGGYSWKGLVDDLKAQQQSSSYGIIKPFTSKMAPKLGKITALNTAYPQDCTVPPKQPG